MTTDARGCAWEPDWSRARRSARRPVPPFPIEPFDLSHPAVPAELDGLTILHLTDLHVRKGRPQTPGVVEALHAVRQAPADLVVHTGDWMNYPGDERSALRTLALFAGSWKARAGVFGTFGNHDSWEFRESARLVGGITWLTPAQPQARPIEGLRLLGFDEPEDLLSVMLDRATPPTNHHELTLALAHYPTEIYAAADLGIPLVLAGHTHGGQFRFTKRAAPHTSCDLPMDLACGILRLRQTLCGVSRGVGNAIVELRLNCPPQIPFYTLRRGPLPPISSRDFNRLTLQHAW